MFKWLYGEKDGRVKSVASYPEYFDSNTLNLSTVAMLHELMHTYIPLEKRDRFENSTQELVYDVINHSLVELASNCELGMKICGTDSYFQLLMHNEILKQRFQDSEGAKKDFYISQGVEFPPEYEFECVTEYDGELHSRRTVTQKDELSNDKIRGIVYPYFLAFKNRENENPTESIINEMKRDKASITKIYGQNFFERISSPEYINSIISTVKDAENLMVLNDVVAREAFGIEKQVEREGNMEKDNSIRQQEFEKKYKDAIFSKISEVYSRQFETISQMTTNATNLGQSQVSIPNASTTLNNKLVGLSHEFKKSGISMFSSYIKDYDMVSSSFLGDAIIHDLIDKLAESTDRLGEFGKTMEDVSKQRNERLLALQNISPIRKFFSRIRAFFIPIKPVDLSLTESEQSIFDGSLQEYKDIDSEIRNYNLENNIVQALVKEIAGSQKFGEFDIPHRYSASGVPGLLQESVIPDLKKLGLEHLIPQLQEALVEEYKKDLPDPEIYQVKDEDMHLYVPDFSRKPDRPHEITEEELYDMHQQAQESIKSSEKTLKSIKRDKILGGLGLKSIEAVDLSVSASERKVATEVISSELSQEQSNDREKTDSLVEKDDEIIID